MRSDTDIHRGFRRHALSALSKRQLWPAFQPIVRLSDKTVAGYEILARWTHPVLGEVQPLSFIPLFTKHGMIDALTEYMIVSACTAVSRHRSDFTLSFNICPSQICNPSFHGWLAELIQRLQFSPRLIELEVTEVGEISDEDIARNNILKLREYGFNVSMDDFGVGLSNIDRLLVYGFDKLKLDASITSAMLSQSAWRQSLPLIFNTLQRAGISVVAEGVELPEQCHALAKMGCEFAQGWLFGKPQPFASTFNTDAGAA